MAYTGDSSLHSMVLNIFILTLILQTREHKGSKFKVRELRHEYYKWASGIVQEDYKVSRNEARPRITPFIGTQPPRMHPCLWRSSPPQPPISSPIAYHIFLGLVPIDIVMTFLRKRSFRNNSLEIGQWVSLLSYLHQGQREDPAFLLLTV